MKEVNLMSLIGKAHFQIRAIDLRYNLDFPLRKTLTRILD